MFNELTNWLLKWRANSLLGAIVNCGEYINTGQKQFPRNSLLPNIPDRLIRRMNALERKL